MALEEQGHVARDQHKAVVKGVPPAACDTPCEKKKVKQKDKEQVCLCAALAMFKDAPRRTVAIGGDIVGMHESLRAAPRLLEVPCGVSALHAATHAAVQPVSRAGHQHGCFALLCFAHRGQPTAKGACSPGEGGGRALAAAKSATVTSGGRSGGDSAAVVYGALKPGHTSPVGGSPPNPATPGANAAAFDATDTAEPAAA